MIGIPAKSFSLLPKSLSGLSIWISIVLITFIVVSENFNPKSGNVWKEVIESDGRGYYAYLPSFFLYGEYNFNSVISREYLEYPAVKAGDFIIEVNGKKIDKYFAGVSFLLIPFFLIAWALSFLFGFPMDGYNFLFQISVSVASLFYLFAGLVFTKKLLVSFGVADKVIALVLFLIVFGTNLLGYAVSAPAMSHIFSFAAIAAFLFFTRKYFIELSYKALLLALFSLAVVILIRPLNGIIILLIPFVAESTERFKKGFRYLFSKPLFLIVSIIIFFIIIGIQPVLWYLQCGEWIVWSYSGEGFYFGNPQLLKVLVSYQKGFFIYTPMALLSLIGLLVLYKRNRFQFFFLSVFFILLIWLVSAWWNWYYGDSFGQRVFIDFYSLGAFLMAVLISWGRKKIFRYFIFLIAMFFLFLNLFQNWQYSRGIIHPYAMNKEKYWHVFLRGEEKYRNIFGGGIDIPPYGTDMNKPVKEWFNNFEQPETSWITSGRKNVGNTAFSGNYVSVLDSNQRYSSALLLSGDSTLYGKKNLYATVIFYLYEINQRDAEKASLVVSLSDKNDSLYFWNNSRINEMPVEKYAYWRKALFGFVLPVIKNEDDKLKIFVWNMGEGKIFIDDFEVKIYCGLKVSPFGKVIPF